MSKLVRPSGARLAPVSSCEPLEARRLLAVAVDSTFGGGDGFVSLRSPFPAEDINGGGENVSNPIFPHLMGELGGDYIAFSTHLVLDDSSTPISGEAVHAVVTRDGVPSPVLAKDSDEDGLAFFTLQQGSTPNQLFGPGSYLDWIPLPGGGGLALNRFSETGQQVVHVQADGSINPFFEIEGFTQVRAIEALSDDVGILISAVDASDAELPIGPEDQVLQVQLFDVISGELLTGGDILPFGEWLRLDDIQGAVGLHMGRDGAVYVSTVTNDIDGAGGGNAGFLIARLVQSGAVLARDATFGSMDLPGQITAAAFLTSSDATPAFEFIGATPGRRAWVRMADADTTFALLTTTGQIDPAFGAGGTVSLDFISGGVFPLAQGSPAFTDADSLTTAPRPFVRGDGSLLGVTSIPAGTTLPDGGPFEFLVGVYGIMPDGSFDPRIAEPGTTWGTGRTIIGADVDAPGIQTDQIQAAVYMDAQERLVLLSEAENTAENAIDLVFARLLVNTPRAELVDRLDGNRVLEIEGTSGVDRLILRPGAEGAEFHLFSQSTAGPESLIGVFSADGVDLIEMSGGEGDDVLFNEVHETFAGFVTLFGGNGNDTLSSHGRYARIFGDAGDDTLLGGLGDQLIFGGEGNDSLLGGAGRDAIYGEAGDDVLRGQLAGDFLDGGEGNDTLAGDEDDDTLVGGLGSDSMVGNDGVDLVSYAGREEDLVIRLGASGNGPAAGFEDDFVGDDVENALGGNGNDSIVGSDGRNFLLGGNGNDTLLGLGGKDTLLAGLGADLLDGGDDTDLLLDLDSLIIIDDADTLIGGGGEDLGLIGSATEDEVLETERVFLTLEELLAVL